MGWSKLSGNYHDDETIDEGIGLETAPENSQGDDNSTAQQVANILGSSPSQWANNLYQNIDTSDNQSLGFQDYDDTKTDNSVGDADNDSDDDDDGF